MSGTRAIFLDRDGVLNDLVYYADTDEYESPRRAADLRLLPDVIDALQRFQAEGWMLFVVSNQPSYAKGKCTLDDLKGVAQAMSDRLASHGVAVRAFYYDYTHPQAVLDEYRCESPTRKPAPGFLLRAAKDYAIDLTHSWMIGDRDTDIQCGQAAGCLTALITTSADAAKRGQSQPDFIGDTLTDVVEMLLRRETETHAKPR